MLEFATFYNILVYGFFISIFLDIVYFIYKHKEKKEL